MTYRLLTISLCSLLMLSTACAQTEEPPPVEQAQQDVRRAAPAAFERVMDYARAENLHEQPLGEIMQAIGTRFAGTPYKAGMLDEPAQETLVLRFDGFDCVLFVETVLAMAHGIAAEDYTFDAFARRIEAMRYREGMLDGYCSRLHYFSDWIADNEQRGTVHNITREVGGEPLDKTLDFMSTHRESYPRFATNDSLFQGIQAMEARLTDLDLYYIPQERIRDVYDQLQPGDIIALATSIDGLDVTHTGLVYKDADGGTGLLHASTSGGVKVSPDLQSYVENNKSQIGIVVARPVAPRS